MTSPPRGLLMLAALALVITACRPGEVPRSTPAAAPAARRPPGGAVPVVRVGVVVERPSVELASDEGFVLTGSDGVALAEAGPGEEWTATPGDGNTIRFRGPSRSLVAAGPVITTPGRGSPLSVDGTAFRGEVMVRRGGDGVTAINVLDLEAYLLGVVPREIGRRPLEELAAVKAQAVAARTYAIGNLGARESLGFDFFGTDRDQVYGGVAVEDPVSERAVRETRGEIITYDGVPILAYYSSTCGGRTAAIEESWPWRAPLPYLRPVSDEIPGSDAYYCSTSNRFRWTVEWNREELRAALGAALRAHTAGAVGSVGTVEDLELVATGPSGRRTVRLEADGREHVLRGDSIRWVLRTPSGAGLNSSRLDALEVARDGTGVAALTVHGGGWGHGIGMCQVGAMGRARAGQTYTTILETYYTNTRIQRLY